MKWRRWVIAGVLLALVLGTGAAYLATRENSRPKAKTGAAQVAEVPIPGRFLPLLLGLRNTSPRLFLHKMLDRLHQPQGTAAVPKA